MDGIEKITGRIAEDAGREIDSLLADARRQADEITARYEAQARRESEDIISRGKRNADERVERLASVAQLDARKLELAAKQEMLARAYDLALEQLLNLPEKEYVALLADLAVKASSTGREAVIFSQKDRTRYGKAVVTQANERLGDGHLTLSEQTRPIKGGLILSDGDVEVNCTFETLVRLQRGEMDREVAKVLFD
ncbi:V-type ATP synthase subunit E [Intestinimonas massiliensis (ex Afouda et al. 2020)]|uniref:V-type ATP synthase subunit E n=1 Tax=Intestinimonas massiliensis (ex Afouda et al. 2020) TaxID=1673721 RepID=UPI00102FB35E|nr:V-type ATP synthase subunit E family protein [Intestinimonas massiliensis (ex Afouda et al. 2020)]